ncbi:YqiA/YcfP family alpha/beta fold hydrolase [Alteromonas sp. ASW11-36]|uniref:YqiA/YcfP family alpha/beta fold hydrolase n=1 Tax=Alteromonas arenosi TaxID=3055817 RepID=A0ABT7SZU0_9ALTE|nr:YqiA/YcfP family alpha/beta fold hydrolase [Alteromonas sp. ASW11-36]MDM7861700.1 YqiA/YcfP family alpha/beta fold hydrolase [Alteromonas sp. ASW11-36]
MHVVYLHGFLSSPQSEKAQLTQAYVAEHYPQISLITPQIPNTIDAVPAVLHKIIEPIVASGEPLRLIGSSMGGFLSNWLIEQFGGRAVLINPAVAPYNLMQDYLGKHTNPYSGEEFYVTADHIEQLRAMEPAVIAEPAAYKVLLQQGDETLDYRLAEARYSGGDITVEAGGDHSFVDFADHLEDIFTFLFATNPVAPIAQ